MAFVGGTLGHGILKVIHPPTDPEFASSVETYDCSKSKLLTHFGPDIFSRVRGKTVIDFGAGKGREVVEFAKHGAKRVIGIEIQERFRREAKAAIQHAGLNHICSVAETTDEKADLAFSLDSFEHFDDPGGILQLMADLIHDDGEVMISFGWPWYHPNGGHLFSVFPWAHLMFTEACLCKWRAEFKEDGATRFSEVEGGLNQMTIQRFEQLVAQSELELVEMQLTPIRPLRWLHCRLTREFTTALIGARLRKRN